MAGVSGLLGCRDQPKPQVRLGSTQAPRFATPYAGTARERIERRLTLDARSLEALPPGYRAAYETIPSTCAALVAQGCEDAGACEARYLRYLEHNGEILSHPPHGANEKCPAISGSRR